MFCKRIITILILTSVFTTGISADDDFAALFDEIEEELESENPEDKIAETPDIFKSEQDLNINLSGEHVSSLRFSYIPDYMDFKEFYRTPQVRNVLGTEVSYKNIKLLSDWELYILARNPEDDILEANPLENVLSAETGDFNFSIGWQFFNWGTADMINPTDNLNPRDYTRGPESEKLPVFSLGIRYFPVSKIGLEAVYIPFKPGSVTGSTAQDLLSSTFHSSEINNNEPEYEFRNFTAGARASFYLPAMDFSLSYIYNFTDAKIPDISLVSVGPVFIPDTIELERERVHQIGFDLRTNAGRFGLWNETMFSFMQGYEKGKTLNPQLNWVFGFDFSFGPNGRHYFNAQYLGFYTFNYDDDFYTDYPGGSPLPGMGSDYYSNYYNRLLVNRLAGINEGLLQGISINTDLDFADSFFCPSFTAAYFLPLIYNDKIMTDGEVVSYKRLGSCILQAAFDFMPVDSFHIIIGSDLYMSLSRINGEFEIDESDRIGSGYKYSTVYIEVSYKWGIDFKK